MPALRVLVVDDSPQDRGLVVRELQKAVDHPEILEAIDQKQLDAHLAKVDFDLVVTDYHLQWSNGIRVLQAVKKSLPNCPVIMFTATGNEEIAVEAMKKGLDDYIIKNVKHLVRLRGAIQAVLQHAATKKRAEQLASRLESLLGQLRVGVFSCTPAGRFLELNDAMIELLECETESDAYQRTLQTLFPIKEQGDNFLKDIVATKVPRESELNVGTGANETKAFRLNARFIDAEGEPSRIDGLLEDVTRRKQSEADAKQAAVAAAQIAMLSPRESEVLREVVAGCANKVVARRLEISEKTVEKHRSNVMTKLQVHSVAELVRLAMLAENDAR